MQADQQARLETLIADALLKNGMADLNHYMLPARGEAVQVQVVANWIRQGIQEYVTSLMNPVNKKSLDVLEIVQAVKAVLNDLNLIDEDGNMTSDDVPWSVMSKYLRDTLEKMGYPKRKDKSKEKIKEVVACVKKVMKAYDVIDEQGRIRKEDGENYKQYIPESAVLDGIRLSLEKMDFAGFLDNLVKDKPTVISADELKKKIFAVMGSSIDYNMLDLMSEEDFEEIAGKIATNLLEVNLPSKEEVPAVVLINMVLKTVEDVLDGCRVFQEVDGQASLPVRNSWGCLSWDYICSRVRLALLSSPPLVWEHEVKAPSSASEKPVVNKPGWYYKGKLIKEIGGQKATKENSQQRQSRPNETFVEDFEDQDPSERKPDEIDNLNLENILEKDFMECAKCREKPGMATLCSACLYNRRLVSFLKERCVASQRKAKNVLKYLINLAGEPKTAILSEIAQLILKHEVSKI